MLTIDAVKTAFAPFEQGNSSDFFNTYVADNVDWTITGHGLPFSGRLTSKREVLDKAVNPVTRCFATPITRKIKNVLVSGDWAIVELSSHATTTKGSNYDQEFCWVCRFNGGKIVEVRMYTDTALFKKVLEENAWLTSRRKWVMAEGYLVLSICHDNAIDPLFLPFAAFPWRHEPKMSALWVFRIFHITFGFRWSSTVARIYGEFHGVLFMDQSLELTEAWRHCCGDVLIDK